MIIVGVIGLFESLFSSLLGLLPSPSVPGINSLATQVVTDGWFGHLSWVNDYIPLDSMITAGLLVLTVWGVMWLVNATIWLLGKFHVFGGGD